MLVPLSSAASAFSLQQAPPATRCIPQANNARSMASAAPFPHLPHCASTPDSSAFGQVRFIQIQSHKQNADEAATPSWLTTLTPGYFALRKAVQHLMSPDERLLTIGEKAADQVFGKTAVQQNPELKHTLVVADPKSAKDLSLKELAEEAKNNPQVLTLDVSKTPSPTSLPLTAVVHRLRGLFKAWRSS